MAFPRPVISAPLDVQQTIWGDWIITLDGRSYAGPYDSRTTAEGMAAKLSPLAGGRLVDAEPPLAGVCELIHAA